MRRDSNGDVLPAAEYSDMSYDEKQMHQKGDTHVDTPARTPDEATGGKVEASPTDDREQRRIVLSLLVEVSRGMSADRMLEWFDFIRHDLEKICWGAEDDDMFMVLRVDLPGRTLTLAPLGQAGACGIYASTTRQRVEIENGLIYPSPPVAKDGEAQVPVFDSLVSDEKARTDD
jgi:hypothetical protein